MTSTQTVHDLVREGRVSPENGAMLLEMRNEIAANRERAILRKRPFALIALFLGVFVLSLLGVRRNA